MPVLSLDYHLLHNTPHIPSRYNNEQTTKQTRAINNSYIYTYLRWRKPCRTFHPWCLRIKTHCLSFICARINGWINNGEAGDLRRYWAHYDVIVMYCRHEVQQVQQSRSRSDKIQTSDFSILIQKIRCLCTDSRMPILYWMMTSSNGNIFRVTRSLCGEFAGHWWIPFTKASDAELCWFRWSAPE